MRPTIALALQLAQPLLASSLPKLVKDGLPAEPTGVKEIISAHGARIRYKQPGKQGVCQNKVEDYSGYISLNEKTNMFFWFFEAQENPNEKPLSLWLNGGPGSDSLLGLFQEHGPCNVTETLETMENPYSWNKVSNMLYLSQPVGVGFSYESIIEGTYLDNGTFLNATEAPPQGRFSLVDPATTNTTKAAAIGAWHILQAFLELSPQLDSNVTNRTFHFGTESYGGHYGPTFYDYFYEQNTKIVAGEIPGTSLDMGSLLIINGVVSAQVQVPYYPVFAVNNTYGIKGLTDDEYLQALDDFYAPGACRDQLWACGNQTVDQRAAFPETCKNATDWCRGYVEGAYIYYSGRGVYDIRHPYQDPTPPKFYIDYLNLASTQEALGVRLNYSVSDIVFNAFYNTGDWAFTDYKTDLEEILDRGVSVGFVYGDADYICNWFGGEAISLALEHKTAPQFRNSNYTSFLVDGEEFGQVRQYGNYSFVRLYEAGHETPFYQPKASLEQYYRLINNLVIADGSKPVTADYQTIGTPTSNHTEPYPPLPTGSASATV